MSYIGISHINSSATTSVLLLFEPLTRRKLRQAPNIFEGCRRGGGYVYQVSRCFRVIYSQESFVETFSLLILLYSPYVKRQDVLMP